MANYAKKIKLHFEKMYVGRNLKVPDLILSTLSPLKADIGLKRFFRKIGIICQHCDFKTGGLPYISSCSSSTIKQKSGLIFVLYARQITISLSLTKVLYEKEGSTIFRKSCASFAFKYI